MILILQQGYLNNVRDTIDRIYFYNNQPVILVSPNIRPVFRKLIEMVFPHIMVISLNEIPNDVEISTEGVVYTVMIIKKYLVKNMNEALTRIRYELGKDAIIVSQRKVREPGFKGYFKPK